MKARSPLAVLILVLALVAGVAGSAPAAGQGGVPPPPGMATLLRYIGRDAGTGMPVPVNDRFIAAHDQAVARYGKDEQPPEPPPPVTGLDISSLVVPRLGLRAPVARLGLDRFGRLDVPQDTSTAGWHPAYSALPGSGGATFVAAHFEYRGVPGIFFRLSALQAGDEIIAVLSDGSAHSYRVTSTVDYALAAIDMGAILRGREGVESITLMTCSGPANEGEYAFRTVVLAESVMP